MTSEIIKWAIASVSIAGICIFIIDLSFGNNELKSEIKSINKRVADMKNKFGSQIEELNSKIERYRR